MRIEKPKTQSVMVSVRSTEAISIKDEKSQASARSHAVVGAERRINDIGLEEEKNEKPGFVEIPRDNNFRISFRSGPGPSVDTPRFEPPKPIEQPDLSDNWQISHPTHNVLSEESNFIVPEYFRKNPI